jgi:uroporphyrinogen decarboxylase
MAAAMTRRERFQATVRRMPVDRPAGWLGLPSAEALPGLLEYFGATTLGELKLELGDDIYPVWLPYHSPHSDKISAAFDFAGKGRISQKERTWTAEGFFNSRSEPNDIDEFPWPDPKAHIDPEECRRAVQAIPDGYAALGVVWAAHFQDSCAAFGMETALVKMMAEPRMYQAVVDRILRFYLEASEIFYEACDGRLDAVLLGNDFGSQSGLMVSPDALRRFIFPGVRQLVEQAHRYGLVVMYHSCGSIRPVISDLVGVGVDVIHPIQARAAGMDIQGLRRDFGDLVSFCGGVDTQRLLVSGSQEEVRQSVRRLKELFPTGLIISPSHEAILPDVPPQNIEALFRAVRE